MGETQEGTVLSNILAHIDRANECRYNYLIRIESALSRFASNSPQVKKTEGKNEASPPSDCLASKFTDILNTNDSQNKLLEELTERLEKIM